MKKTIIGIVIGVFIVGGASLFGLETNALRLLTKVLVASDSIRVNKTSIFNGAMTSNAKITNTGGYVGNDSARFSGQVTANSNVLVNRIITRPTAQAFDSTGTIASGNLMYGYVTCTSGAAVTLTLPTATNLATSLGAIAGTVFDFVIDNTAGSNTITVVGGTGIVVGNGVLTGGNTLTITATDDVGVFRIIFTSTTAARIFRIG